MDVVLLLLLRRRSVAHMRAGKQEEEEGKQRGRRRTGDSSDQTAKGEEKEKERTEATGYRTQLACCLNSLAKASLSLPLLLKSLAGSRSLGRRSRGCLHDCSSFSRARVVAAPVTGAVLLQQQSLSWQSRCLPSLAPLSPSFPVAHSRRRHTKHTGTQMLGYTYV